MTKLDPAAVLQRFSVALLLSLTLCGQAFAHAQLVSSTPAANETAKPPVELRLKFSEVLELKFTTVKVKGPNDTAVKTGPPKLDAGDNTLLIVPLAAPLSLPLPSPFRAPGWRRFGSRAFRHGGRRWCRPGRRGMKWRFWSRGNCG